MIASGQSKPVILLAFANAREEQARYLRNLPEEARRLEAALDRARRAGLCELVVRHNVTADELFGVFQDPDYRHRIAVLHYGGHADGYQLLLESASGAVAVAHGQGLAAFLGQQRGLQLVFLNGCSTEPQVQGLLEAGVGAVIATAQAVEDEVAMDFAARFYGALASGASLGSAYEEARGAVVAIRGGAVRGFGKPYYRAEAGAGAGERWPWRLEYKRGAEEQVKHWNLPEAANDPLFGLPALPRQHLPESPYRHLHWFGREHAEVFFGRGRAIRELYNRVIDPSADPIILLFGQSGVGKSSLLAAGLLPRLESAHTVRYVRRVQAEGLFGTLRQALSLEEETTALRSAWQGEESAGKRPLILVLDQVEEVYTRPNPEQPKELEDFCATLGDIFGDLIRQPQGKLILGFRKEWLPEIDKVLGTRRLPRSHFFLELLDRQGLMEAILGPTQTPRLQEHYGLTVEDGLAETIADVLLGDPQAALAPTLQILLAKLWQVARRRDPARPRFDQPLYLELKQQGLLLGDFLDQQLADLKRAQPDLVRTGLALDVLAYHTTVRGTAEERRVEDLQTEYRHRLAVLPMLIEACKDRYLLIEASTTQRGSGDRTRLAHDTLAPLVRERSEQSDFPGQRARRILESRAVDWVEERQGASLDEVDLAVVEHGAQGMRAWTGDETRLIQASRAARGSRVRQHQRQKGLNLLAVVIILATAVFALWQWRLAIERENESRAQAERARRATYNTQLARAWDLWDSRPSQALVLLEDGERCPPELRNFTWGLLHRMANRERRVLEGHADDVTSVVFSPDGQTLASGSRDGRVRLWDAGSGEPRATLEGHVGGVSSVAFSPDGQMLASSGSKDETVRLWRASQELKATLKGHDNYVTAVAYAPDGRTLASGGLDETVRLWDAASGEPQAILEGHAGGVSSVAFAPDGGILASGSMNGTVQLWDAPSRKLQATLEGHTDRVNSVVFSPDGRTLASGGRDGTVWLWWVASRALQLTLAGHRGEVESVDFSPNGQTLASGGGDGTLRFWSVRSGELRLMLEGHSGGVESVVFSPDGRTLASGGRDWTVRLWNVVSRALPATLQGHNGGVESVVFSPDGRILASGGLDGTVRLWDAASGAPRATLKGHTQGVWSVVFSPDGQTLAAGGGDGTVRIWAVANGALQATLEAHADSVESMAFSPDGRTLASASPDSKVRLWDAASGALQVTLAEHRGGVATVVFSPDGRTLASGGGDGVMRLWDVASGALQVTLKGHRGGVESVVFSADGQTLASGSTDGKVRLWDAASGELQATLEGHAGVVESVVFSPDGRTLASGNRDTTVRLWDAVSGELQAILEGHTDHVISVVFSPDGQTLASGSTDGKVRLWRAASDRE